jgi:hypothetical protein
MTKIRRGTAHCRTRDCFALEYTCPRCGRAAAIDAEFGTGLGASHHYNEVRVYFAFSAATRTYTDFVRIEDATIVGQHSAYAFFTPLVSDRAEAEHLAAALLAKLNGARSDARPLCSRATSEDLRREGWRIAS